MADNAPVVTLECGASASIAPKFHLVPLKALVRLCNRFEFGAHKHGAYNWMNGLPGTLTIPPTPDPRVAYALERANHVVYHALRLQAKLQGLLPPDQDDDAGAIMWGGAFLSEVVDALKGTIDV